MQLGPGLLRLALQFGLLQLGLRLVIHALCLGFHQLGLCQLRHGLLIPAARAGLLRRALGHLRRSIKEIVNRRQNRPGRAIGRQGIFQHLRRHANGLLAHLRRAHKTLHSASEGAVEFRRRRLGLRLVSQNGGIRFDFKREVAGLAVPQ